jgi:hypothetical protein
MSRRWRQVMVEGSGFGMRLSRRQSMVLLLASTAVASWYGMMIVHELGHVVGALLTGGRVERVVLHPLAFSRTDLASNPRPLVVVWAGPAVGVALPAAMWLLAHRLGFRFAFLLRAFAGFCLIANGAYLGSAAMMPVGDAADMVRLGSPAWVVTACGVVGLAGGLALWSGLGPKFGLGKGHPVERGVLVVACGCAAVLFVGVLACSWI